jgi:hypothetical protein
MTIWRLRIVCWTPNATNTHPEYVTLIVFLLQLWLHERASMLRHTPAFQKLWSADHQVVLGFCPCGPLRLNISPKESEKY